MLCRKLHVHVYSTVTVCGYCFIFLKTIEELEKEMLNGQKLQGPLASYEVHQLLKKEDKEKE